MVIMMTLPQLISADDMARYRELVSGMDMSDAQRDDVILILREIFQAAIDRAHGIDSVQISCHQNALEPYEAAKEYATVASFDGPELISNKPSDSSTDIAIQDR
jgi:hypothetical protein